MIFSCKIFSIIPQRFYSRLSWILCKTTRLVAYFIYVRELVTMRTITIKRLYVIGLVLVAPNIHAENWEQAQDLANLYQTVGRLNLEIEALKAKNEDLEKRLVILDGEVAELKKLPTALELHKDECQAAIQTCKQEIAQQTPPKSIPAELSPPKQEIKSAKPEPVRFSENYPKEGVIYTVKPGDTLSKITQEHHSSVTDLQNANKIADPKMLQAGQELFVPIAE